jgi:hypothetical protein
MAGTSTYNDLKTVLFPADGSQNIEQDKLKLPAFQKMPQVGVFCICVWYYIRWLTDPLKMWQVIKYLRMKARN